MLLEKEKSEKSIKNFSWRVMRRLSAAGDGNRAFSIEDIQQELFFAWAKASESFSAEQGVPFQAYLMNGMRLHINRLIEKHIGRRHQEVIAASLDAAIGSPGGERTQTLADVIPDTQASMVSQYEEDQHFVYTIRKLNARAKLFITLLRDQPEELMAEVMRLRSKSDYARQLTGVATPSNNRLTTWMVFDLMDAPNAERSEIIREIRALGKSVCGAMAR